MFSALLTLALAATPAPVELPAEGGAPDAVVAAQSVAPAVTLKEMLEKGLKVRRPQDFTFIATVIKLVDEDKLPLKMVQSTFVWARRKSRPFQYFQAALRVQAKEIGVNL